MGSETTGLATKVRWVGSPSSSSTDSLRRHEPPDRMPTKRERARVSTVMKSTPKRILPRRVHLCHPRVRGWVRRTLAQRPCMPVDFRRSSVRKVAVTNRLTAATVLLLLVAAVGCSSSQSSAKPKPGTLPPGTAAVVINGNDLGRTDEVQCTQAEWLTTIRTGRESSGVTVMVSNARKLAAEIVRIRDLDGFAGSYDRGLQGSAAVTLTGSTYAITGTATGFNHTKSSALTTETFAIKVAC